MATKYKVNYELKGDSSVPVTRTECIKHCNTMLDECIENLSNSNKFVEYNQHEAKYNSDKIALNGYQHISKMAYGLRENATGLGVLVNSNGAPEVMNVDTKGLSTYADRDIVGAYISADGAPPLYTVPINKITYNSNGCIVDYDMPNLLSGMVIDTLDGNYVGIVKTFDSETGTVVLEDGWYNKTTHEKGLPVGTGFWVQKTSKVWGINVNVGLPSGIKTNGAVIEGGLYNNGSTGGDRGVYDAVLLKGDGDYGVRSRGNFWVGLLSDGTQIGYQYRSGSPDNPAVDSRSSDGVFYIYANGKTNRTIKKVREVGTNITLDLDYNFIIEAATDATVTLPESAPSGTIIELFTASSNSITVNAPSGETIWYESGYDTSASFSGVNHSLTRFVKYSSNQWLVFIQHMADLNTRVYNNDDYNELHSLQDQIDALTARVAELEKS